jgi:hypothetical protein
VGRHPGQKLAHSSTAKGHGFLLPGEMEQMKLPFIETNFISANASFEKSRGVILGCPYDGSASFRPGARFGPSAIRRASWGIETFSPYFKKDLSQCSIHDMGDLELPLRRKNISQFDTKALAKSSPETNSLSSSEGPPDHPPS